MNEILEKKVSIKTLLIIILTFTFSFILIAATPSTIQAYLSSDITIKYNGTSHVFKDQSGNVLQPLTYNGITYVPLKAFSDLINLPLNYISELKIIELGSSTSNPKSLLDVTDIGIHVRQFPAGGTWQKVNNVSELPTIKDEFNNIIGSYDDAIKLDSIYIASKMYPSMMSYTLNGNYNSLSFTAISNTISVGNESFYVEISDYEKNIVLWSATLKSGERIYANNVKLTGVKSILITGYSTSSSSSVYSNKDFIYLCDPRVS